MTAKAMQRAARPASDNADVTDATTPPVIGELSDGTAYFAPLGVLVVIDDGARVICHLCGNALRLLSTSHLRRHGWTPHGYRETFGLGRSVPLCAPEVSDRRRELGAQRYRSNSGTRGGLRRGQQMARNGELLKLSHQVQQPGTARLQRRQQIRTATEPQRAALRAAAAARRLAKVHELGFTSERDYLADRYLTQRWPVSRIKSELQVGSATLTEVLDGAGIIRRRPGGAAPANARWERVRAHRSARRTDQENSRRHR